MRLFCYRHNVQGTRQHLKRKRPEKVSISNKYIIARSQEQLLQKKEVFTVHAFVAFRLTLVKKNRQNGGCRKKSDYL